MLWDWDFALRILPRLLHGAAAAAAITTVAFLVAVAAGVVLEIACRLGGRIVALPVAMLSDVVRKTPILIQLYAAYFVLPVVGIDMTPIQSGIAVLGAHYAFYMKDIYAGALAAVPAGQFEAARVLGLSPADSYVRIIVPQALPVIVPNVGNILIYMFKDAPFLGAISVYELMQVALKIGGESFRYAEPMTTAGILFLVMSLVVAALTRSLEKFVSLKRGA